MTLRTLYAASVLASFSGLAICGICGGWRAACGFGLGLSSTFFGIVVWWYVTGFLCHGLKPGAKPLFGAVLVVFAFLWKLPLFLGTAILAVKIGGPAKQCFIAGLGLVYCCLVGRSLVRDGVRTQ